MFAMWCVSETYTISVTIFGFVSEELRYKVYLQTKAYLIKTLHLNSTNVLISVSFIYLLFSSYFVSFGK